MIVLLLGGLIFCPVRFCFVNKMSNSVSEKTSSEAYLAFYFKDSGQDDGLFVAGSRDGICWKEWNKNGIPLFRSTLENGVFRDPSVLRDKKGAFRMVWTAGPAGFGYSSSENLVDWKEPRLVSVSSASGENPWKNIWAPEIFYSEHEDVFYILWAATFKGVAHPNEKSLPWYKHKYDHRHYYQKTRDWETFTEPRRFPGPEISHYDGMLFRDRDRFYWVYKHAGKLWLSSSSHILGPYTDLQQVPNPETPVEGGYALRVGGEWFIYFDEFLLGGKYGFVSSGDLIHWSEPKRIAANFVIRHGSFQAVSLHEWKRLEKISRGL